MLAFKEKLSNLSMMAGGWAVLDPESGPVRDMPLALDWPLTPPRHSK